MKTLAAPPRRSAPDQRITRGAAIFASEAAGCAGCHRGALTTDGLPHDVASKTPADAAAIFNTPSLRDVWGTGPYFHDGRYATLRELLVATDGTMGHTKHLSPPDLDSLEAYLGSL